MKTSILFLLVSFRFFAQENTVFLDASKQVCPIFINQKNLSKQVEIQSYFNTLLLQLTSINYSDIKPKKTSLQILFSNNPKLKKEEYTIVKKNHKLIFSASTMIGFKRAIDYFFYWVLKTSSKDSSTIPKKLQIQRSPDFEYREVYFSDNFKPENRKKYATHHLEDEWGLWGHNLKKIVARNVVSDSIYALINGKRNKEQLCFSSQELYQIVKTHILNTSDKNQFVIAPYDNNLVCQCNLCKKTGNTKTNASPSVFSFITRVATTFPHKKIVSLAYTSTKNPPPFLLPKNVGVFLSTIDCQESLPFKNTKKGQLFLKSIDRWKEKVESIYVWDYVVNFDNFLEYYPILKATKENLKSYKEKGVIGVFLQGSGYHYSFLESIKYKVLAQLLWNSDLNVDTLLLQSLKTAFPNSFLTWNSFIQKLEDNVTKHKYKQSIYTGLLKTTKKLVSFKELDTLKKHSNKNKKQQISLSFLQLELLRNKGLKNTLFCVKKKNQIKLKHSILSYITTFIEQSKKLENIFINEQGFTLQQYTNDWKNTLSFYNHHPYFYQLKITSSSILDDDYSNLSILNDGSFGFENYTSNWFIFSQKTLELQIKVSSNYQLKKIKFLSVGFLNDPKHHIYLPKKINVYINNHLLKTITTDPLTTLKVVRKKIYLKPITASDKLTIQFFNTNKSIAIDEIQFLK